jgi:hypothetical protein
MPRQFLELGLSFQKLHGALATLTPTRVPCMRVANVRGAARQGLALGLNFG